MSAESMQPGTMYDIDLVLRVAPDLTKDGFDSYYQAEYKRKNLSRFLRGLPSVERPPSIPITDPYVQKGIGIARLFLREKTCPSIFINRALSSLVLSHDATHWFGTQREHHDPLVPIPFVSNGAFIAGAILEGYTLDIDGPSAYLPLTLTPWFQRLRQLKADIETMADDAIARKKIMLSS
jgi:hypothetical protein